MQDNEGSIPSSQRILQEKTLEMHIEKFIKKELPTPTGVAEVQVKPGKGGIGKDIWIFCQNPGIAIGQDGWRVKKMEKEIREEFDLDKVKVSVKEVQDPNLNAEIVANRTAATIERGTHIRRAGWSTVNRVMNAGALGVSVRVSGKVYSTYSQSYRFADGKLIHSGHPADVFVDKGKASALVKTGKIGVRVEIAKPQPQEGERTKTRPEKNLEIRSEETVMGELEDIKSKSSKMAEETLREARREKE